MLQDIIHRYDALILDLWGVIHDGITPYPGVRKCLEQLRQQKKRVVFLSNAPRRAAAAISVLEEFGIRKDWYERVITSGEVAWEHFHRGENVPSPGPYIYTGLPKDAGLITALGYEAVHDPARAGFILNTGLDDFAQPLEEKLPLLDACRRAGLPMICVNPDLIVVRQSGERILCAGVVAQAYAKLGGEVRYFGKPYPEVYDACREHFGDIPSERILCVGDNLDTDIAGANAAGLDCALITGGILSLELPQKAGEPGLPDPEALQAALRQAHVRPTYTLPRFNWSV